MKKVLFLIHDLGHGGAEKVLVNLVNNLDRTKFDISVTVLFGGGVNEQFLKSDIHFRTVFPRSIPGNSTLMKLLTPKQLHALCVKGEYDYEVSYLEGPSARVVAGCSNKSTKKLAWIHCTMHSESEFASSFRSLVEAQQCYSAMDKVVCVSHSVEEAFVSNSGLTALDTCVRYNTNESEKILQLSAETVTDVDFSTSTLNWCSVGRLIPVKAFDRLLNIQKQLVDSGINTHLYLLGEGELEGELLAKRDELGLRDSVTFLGYQTNPYKYISKCDLFVCSSLSEGFSTATTEALLLGLPIVSTEVSGAKELLGENNEYGIVTENSEKALFVAVQKIFTQEGLLTHYREQAKLRGQEFSTEKTTRAVENLLCSL